MLTEVAGASIRAIEDLQRTIDPAVLRRAVEAMDGANAIHIAGQGAASWIAAYLSHGLTRLGCRCTRIDSSGGRMKRRVSVLDAGDLLVAVSFADTDEAVVEPVSAARARGAAVLAITDAAGHPLADLSNVHIALPASPNRRPHSWAAGMVLAQALILALEKRRAGG